jgi:hypothetical protein
MKHAHSARGLWLTSIVAVAGLTALSASNPGSARGDTNINFADYGKSYLKAHCKETTASACSLDAVRNHSYVHGVFGLFDVAYPIAFLGEKDKADDLHAILTSLLDLQSHWIDWLAKGDAKVNAAKADINEMKVWVKAWKLPAATALASAADKDFFVVCGATEAQKAVAKRLTEFMTNPESLGVGPKDSGPIQLLFSPTRHDFVELLGYAGTVDPTQQGSLWTKSATTWSTFWIEYTQVLALTYPPWTDVPDFKGDLSMSKFEPTGMLENVVQNSTIALLWSVYGEMDTPYIRTALALNMAIAVCGESNVLEGDSVRGTTGAHTDPYERFVPGGASSGGILPAIPAAPLDQMKVNQWRATVGRDHFVGPLRKGQKAGLASLGKAHGPKLEGSLAKDKAAHFLLVGDEAGQKHEYVVSAPFLGAHAKDKPYPPPEVIVDYKEFFRAYKACFYNWLQTMGDAKGAEPSAQKYRELLKALGAMPDDKTTEQVIKDVYGVQLSDKNGDADSLEWRFLKWLDKGK